MLFKKYNLIISTLIIILLNSIIVNAFGVTLPYNPVNGYGEIIMGPGQVADVSFFLQNGVEEDITIKAAINEGSEIAQIIGSDEYFVPTKTKDILVKVRLSVPEKVLSSDKWLVSLHFKKVVTNRAGTALGTGIEQRFYVTVYKPGLIEKINRVLPFKIQELGVFIIFLAILVVLVLFLRKRQQKR